MNHFSTEFRSKVSKLNMRNFDAFIERARLGGAPESRLELYADLIEATYLAAEADVLLRVREPQPSLPELFESQAIEVGNA